MISINQIKFIRSLQQKKNRQDDVSFVVEGPKLVAELLQSGASIRLLCGTDEWFKTNGNEIFRAELITVNEKELKKISSLTTPNQVLAVAEIPQRKLVIADISNELVIGLDTITDPGNLGTIIRLADWFGISTIICSENSVDAYNPKVVQATMGAIFRVHVHYQNMGSLLQKISRDSLMPVYGTFTHGDNIYERKLTENGLLLIGNESHGISKELHSFIPEFITIPGFNNVQKGPESLNASVAAGIICAEFRRRTRTGNLK